MSQFAQFLHLGRSAQLSLWSKSFFLKNGGDLLDGDVVDVGLVGPLGVYNALAFVAVAAVDVVEQQLVEVVLGHRPPFLLPWVVASVVKVVELQVVALEVAVTVAAEEAPEAGFAAEAGRVA